MLHTPERPEHNEHSEPDDSQPGRPSQPEPPRSRIGLAWKNLWDADVLGMRPGPERDQRLKELGYDRVSIAQWDSRHDVAPLSDPGHDEVDAEGFDRIMIARQPGISHEDQPEDFRDLERLNSDAETVAGFEAAIHQARQERLTRQPHNPQL